MEEEYVHNTYNTVAKEFDKTRHSCWKSVREFIESLPPNNLVLDAGCGNGKNMLIRNDLKFVGCDTSEELLKICKDKGLNVVNANIKNLPFPDNYFDEVICIAVLHHIYLELDRVKAISEMIRVLKPGHRLMFQVWAREQELTSKFSHVENSKDPNDFYVTWSGNSKRYYHLFSELDVKKLLAQVYDNKIVNMYFEKDNWVITLEKL